MLEASPVRPLFDAVDCATQDTEKRRRESAGECLRLQRPGRDSGGEPPGWPLLQPDFRSETLAKAIALDCKVANGTGPTLTDTAGFQCASYGGTIFAGVQSTVYSSSSTYVDHVGLVVAAFLNHAIVNAFGKGNELAVWPVRSGAR